MKNLEGQTSKIFTKNLVGFFQKILPKMWFFASLRLVFQFLCGGGGGGDSKLWSFGAKIFE